MCSPVYNFYNCCPPDCGSQTSNQNPTTPTNNFSKVFPIRTSRSGVTTDWRTGDIKYTGHYYRSNLPGNNLEVYNNLEAFHFPYKVKDLSVFKTNESGITNETVELSIIVMDMAGNLKRVISASNIDMISMPFEQWHPVPLVASASDLNIVPGEVVIKKVTVSNVNTDSWHCNMFASGLGEMI